MPSTGAIALRCGCLMALLAAVSAQGIVPTHPSQGRGPAVSSPSRKGAPVHGLSEISGVCVHTRGYSSAVRVRPHHRSILSLFLCDGTRGIPVACPGLFPSVGDIARNKPVKANSTCVPEAKSFCDPDSAPLCDAKQCGRVCASTETLPLVRVGASTGPLGPTATRQSLCRVSSHFL